jgi:hypothetical protein
MQFVIARHGEPGATEAIRSRYAAVLEPFSADGPQVSAEPVRQGGDRIVAVRTRSRSTKT